MSNRKAREGANSLEELDPYTVLPYAAYIPNLPVWEHKYRKYATKGHRASAIKGLRVSTYTLYTYNFDTEHWEEET